MGIVNMILGISTLTDDQISQYTQIKNSFSFGFENLPETKQDDFIKELYMIILNDKQQNQTPTITSFL